MGETTKTGAAPGVGVGETIKQRDYMFDTFRGLLMWSIPISHFTRVAGHFSQASLGGVVYITINVFVMQAFVFLSGYFSKKPDRSKETSFHTFMWPYFWGFRSFILYDNTSSATRSCIGISRRSRFGICGRCSSTATLQRNG